MSLARRFRRGFISLFEGVIRPVVVLGLFFLGLVQVLQPHFFLTSDNLSQMFPVWTEAGRHLLRGENPFVSQYLYGGGYPLYKDPTFLNCLHPLVLIICLLANTPLKFSLIDIFASFQILSACLGMAFLLLALQRRNLVQLAPWQAVVLSLSYGFSGFNLAIGSFWFFYIANQVALPVYFIGFLAEKRIHGILLILLAGTHAFLAGVPSSYLFTVIACSFVICLEVIASRKMEILLRWIAGQVLIALLLSPVLYFSISGFLDSARGQGTTVLPADTFSVPLFTLLLGWFFAGVGGVFGPVFTLINTSLGLSYTLFSIACSWWLFACIVAACRKFRLQSWDLAILGGVLFSLLLVWRPGWLQTLLHQLPFLKSARWSFRETFILVFFLHLWMAPYLGQIPRIWLVRLLVPGLVFLVVSLVYFEPAAFHYHQLDRYLLFSGTAEKHWQRYLNGADPEAMIIPVIDPKMVAEREKDLPLTLLGANNYPAYFNIRSFTGYSSTPPRSALPLNSIYSHPFGYVAPDWVPILQLHGSPPMATSHIESLDPLRVTVEDPNQRLSILVVKPENLVP